MEMLAKDVVLRAMNEPLLFLQLLKNFGKALDANEIEMISGEKDKLETAIKTCGDTIKKQFSDILGGGDCGNGAGSICCIF